MKTNRRDNYVSRSLLQLSSSPRKKNLRTLVVLICSFALTCAARVDQANKNEADAKPSHHTATRNKRTPGSGAHASRATHGKHPAGGSTHIKNMQTTQHVPTGRHAAGVGRAARQKPEVTPTPSPTATPKPSPTDDSTATPSGAQTSG
jgi:hypothetical protein